MSRIPSRAPKRTSTSSSSSSTPGPEAPRPHAPSTTRGPQPPIRSTALPHRLTTPLRLLRTTSTFLLYFASTFCTISLFRTYILDWSLNTGPSMAPTVSASGNGITLYSPWYRGGRGIKLGDMVQVRHPMFERVYAGKRVLGMPGDFVVRDDVSGGGGPAEGVGGVRATRDGVEVEGNAGDDGRQEPRLIRVPEGHVWLAGDNMAWSRDSRSFGPVPMGLIRAKAIWVLDGWLMWRPVWRDYLVPAEEPEPELEPV